MSRMSRWVIRDTETSWSARDTTFPLINQRSLRGRSPSDTVHCRVADIPLEKCSSPNENGIILGPTKIKRRVEIRDGRSCHVPGKLRWIFPYTTLIIREARKEERGHAFGDFPYL